MVRESLSNRCLHNTQALCSLWMLRLRILSLLICCLSRRMSTRCLHRLRCSTLPPAAQAFRSRSSCLSVCMLYRVHRTYSAPQNCIAVLLHEFCSLRLQNSTCCFLVSSGSFSHFGQGPHTALRRYSNP